MVLYWQQRLCLCLTKLIDYAVNWLYNSSMEHPLISNLDSLTEQELLDKVNELNRKLGIAYRTGNGHLCDQLRMAIESYQTKYQDKIRRDPDNNFDEIIDIS